MFEVDDWVLQFYIMRGVICASFTCKVQKRLKQHYKKHYIYLKQPLVFILIKANAKIGVK